MASAPKKVFNDMIEGVLGAVNVDTGGDLRGCDVLLREFGTIDWVDTAFKEDIQIRRPKEAVVRLAGSERVRYRVWIENDDYIAGSVNVSEDKLILGNGRYRSKLFVDKREICTVQEWNRIDVETAAADEAIRAPKIESEVTDPLRTSSDQSVSLEGCMSPVWPTSHNN